MVDPINSTFMNKFWDDMLLAEQATGLPAVIYGGISAYETGWGEDSTVEGNGATYNFFGLKIEPGVVLRRAIGYAVVPTSEFTSSGREKIFSAFAVYPSYLAAALDWYEWVTGRNGLDKYKNMPSNPIDFLDQLMVRGYSTEQPGSKDGNTTSPGYKAQILSVIKRIRDQFPKASAQLPDKMNLHDVTNSLVPQVKVNTATLMVDMTRDEFKGKLNDPDQSFLKTAAKTTTTSNGSPTINGFNIAALKSALSENYKWAATKLASSPSHNYSSVVKAVVAEWQKRMNQNRNAKLVVDGIFGPKSNAAAKKYEGWSL